MTQTTPTILATPAFTTKETATLPDPQGKGPGVRAPRELPILFSTDMVRAILHGKKRKTRRLVGLDYFNINPDKWHNPAIGELMPKAANGKERFGAILRLVSGHGWEAACCPYGKPGNLLWVRETWAQVNGAVVYKADYQEPVEWNWRPSIHMRKDYCRIWLRSTDVHLERLHDISIEDVQFEGLTVQGAGIKEWKELWESINGAESWELNPWVWVQSFEVLSTIGKGGIHV